MYSKTLSIFFIVFLISLSAQSQTLSDLNWLSGYWKSSEKGVVMEELWTPTSGGMMLGIHRDVFDNGRSSFENLRIIETEGVITYLASPGGRPATPFTFKEASYQKVIFENLDNDFPQRIIYSRQENELTARIEDTSGENGMEWTWIKTDFDE